MLSPAVYLEASSFLNQMVTEVIGNDITFYVHYWGAVDKHLDNPVHKHSFFEVCYVMNGEGQYVEDGIEIPLAGGSLFLSRPHVLHQIRSKEGLEIIFVAFEIIDSATTQAGKDLFRRLAVTDNMSIENASEASSVVIWKALLMEILKPQSLYKERINSLACALLASFEQTFSNHDMAHRVRSVRRVSGATMYQAKLFIRDNLSFQFRLIDLANHLHISGRHLSRVFQEELGKSFTDYLRQERIQRAAIMLTTTSKSIKQIAEETGFINIYYFTKVFTSEMKTPPGKFRKQLADE